jgi:hypothetical protein
VLVNHLGDGIAKQNYILIERFNLALQLDTACPITETVFMLATQGVEK